MDPQVPQGVLRCMGICLSRENRFGIFFFFFSSWTAVLGTVPHRDRFVVTLIGHKNN